MQALGARLADTQNRKNDYDFQVVHNVPVVIQWFNEGVAMQDKDIRRSFVENLGELLDPSSRHIEELTNNLFGTAVVPKDIKAMACQYITTGGEKHVFQVVMETGDEKKPMISAVAFKSSKTRDDKAIRRATTRQKEIAQKNKKAVPVFGVQVGPAYYEQWIDGDTIFQINHENPLFL